MTTEVYGEGPDEPGVIDVGAVPAVVAEHERGAHRCAPGTPEDLGKSGRIQATLEHGDLVGVAPTAPHGDGAARPERGAQPGRAAVGLRGSEGRREEPDADAGEPRRQLVRVGSLGKPVVGGEGEGEQAEGRGVPGLVVADAIDGAALLGARSELDQPAVGELGAGLQRHVELAVTTKRLVAQLPTEQRRDLAGQSRHGDEHPGRARPQRRGAHLAVVGGGGRPPREGPLHLAAVDDGRGTEATGTE